MPSIEPAHDETGHYYRYKGEQIKYESVTYYLSLLKDPSLQLYRMNRALEYIEKHWKELSEENLLEHLGKAKDVSEEALTNAGDIGTQVHNIREQYFRQWLQDGEKPSFPASSLTQGSDFRVVSAVRSLDKFVNDTGYIPVACELYVLDSSLKVGGTLDDLGLLNGQLVLMDIKTSNQMKYSYTYQTALYHYFFRKLTGIRPKRIIINKLSKEDGTYKIEEVDNISLCTKEAINVVKVMQGISRLQQARKPKSIKI